MLRLSSTKPAPYTHVVFPINFFPFKKAPLRGGFFVTKEYRIYEGKRLPPPGGEAARLSGIRFATREERNAINQRSSSTSQPYLGTQPT